MNMPPKFDQPVKIAVKACKPQPIRENRAPGLELIVEAYLVHNAANAERYLRFYAIQRSLKGVIIKAAMAELPNGKRFSHQRRIPRRVMMKARDVLLKENFLGIRSFSELYDLLSKIIKPIPGVGLLMVYDTAHRLGAYLKLAPEHVYLHAGVIVGVKALGLPKNEQKLPMCVFPTAFQRLSPEQMEDCLCIYKRELERWAWNQLDGRRQGDFGCVTSSGSD